MKNYIKPFFLTLFNNVFLLMINTSEVNNHLWSLIVFTLLWFLTFMILVVGIRYTKLPEGDD